ncbi:hypothetical protein SLEP1_g47670 [Rubroshorea leprosula]|uniref:Uncharacterized protein n=1 Tax=Rubroshorea leprosula TaxID=152421 RepID=A0AAV5LR96_9ROSI|nr:hypothetical protein SLEP1_g47670 [Rubroshorea leprosula]
MLLNLLYRSRKILGVHLKDHLPFFRGDGIKGMGWGPLEKHVQSLNFWCGGTQKNHYGIQMVAVMSQYKLTTTQPMRNLLPNFNHN